MIAVSPKANKSVATVVALAVVVAVVAVVAAVEVTTSRSKVPNTIKSIEFLGARGPWPPTQTGAIKFIFSYTRDRARACVEGPRTRGRYPEVRAPGVRGGPGLQAGRAPPVS